MLEKYLSRILTAKFDHVVEDFDHEDVNISAWKGEVSLKNLVLKRTALDTFGTDVPFEVVYGKVGSLELQIPWSSLGSKSSSVVLSDVSLLLTPRSVKSDDMEEQTRENQKSKGSKEERVQALLNPLILQHTIAASTKKNKLARLLSWISSSVFTNLTVTIKNIHVRYEDPGSSMGFVWSDDLSPSAFSIGVTLRQFSVQTTNTPDQSTSKDKKLHKNYTSRRKLAAAYQLAVYWDHECPLIAVAVRREADPILARNHAAAAFQIIDGGELDQSLPQNMGQYQCDHSYVLQPFSPSVQFDLVNGEGDTSAPPPSTVTLSLPPCHFILSRALLENVAYLRKSFALWKQSRLSVELNQTLGHLTRIRPTTSPHHDRRAWWKYAIEATILLGRTDGRQRRRRGWASFVHAVMEQNKYVKRYRQFSQIGGGFEKAHHALCDMEHELEEREIAFFRLAAYESMLDITIPDVKREQSKAPDIDKVTEETSSGKLSVEGRLSMMYDAIRILKEGRNVTSRDDSVTEGRGQFEEESPLQWKTSVYCSDMSLQVNGRNSNNSVRPIARLSFASVQHQFLHRDGSWELDATIADIKFVDLAVRGSGYSMLIGLKALEKGTERDEDFVVVSGQRFRRCMNIQLQRTFTRLRESSGSTTHSIIRLQPLEVVYSINPVARLMNVFSSIRTTELAGDYVRMASVVSQWQTRQRQRLLQALAHKGKKITVDVDIAAPVILIPETFNRGKGAMLVIDLGRVQFRDIDPGPAFDDAWCLKLSDMQVQSSSWTSSRETDKRMVNQQIVEPFSLEFKISTTIASTKKENDSTIIWVDASLPRLVFNLTSSSVRLTSTLTNQWGNLKQPGKSKGHLYLSQPTVQRDARANQSTYSAARSKISREVAFLFSAPIIAVKLSDDIGGRDQKIQSIGGTPLVNLAFRGIGGKFVQNINGDGSSSTEFHAKMRSLEAVDLYQQAGHDFALLLSSVAPSSLPLVDLHTLVDLPDQILRPDIDADLVSIKYKARTQKQMAHSLESLKTSILAIKFHELFVEWNPETLAAIQKALRVPTGQEKKENPDQSTLSFPELEEKASDSDDEFFDAFEDGSESFCSAPERLEDNNSDLLSEISSSLSAENSDEGSLSSTFPQVAILSPSSIAKSPLASWKTPPLPPMLAEHVSPLLYAKTSPVDTAKVSLESTIPYEPFELTFELSTLRVAFNKESRHRRLVVAEMDNTSVRHNTREEGGSKTVAKIGNLVFTDPASSDSNTLYGQILGLKTDELSASHAEPSLLEMEFLVNNRKRHFVPLAPTIPGLDVPQDDTEEMRQMVSIDKISGDIQGSNHFVHLRFSPMRFVYLQQLWFEIIDYFFEGITGYEVWGNERPKQFDWAGTFMNTMCSDDVEAPTRRKPNIPGADANGISFTRFRISLASPDVILPIEYRSPHFLRVTCRTLEVSNCYTSDVHQMFPEGGNARDQVQWYNNCSIILQEMRLQSWCGTDLTKLSSDGSGISSPRPDVRILMTWPTGPTAMLVTPKWRVRCDFDEINLTLRDQDYALFQHVVVFNIGEPSRHLDEWARFQEMSLEQLEAYKQRISVHYGYDKKDSAPSTYDVEVLLPSIGVNFLGKSDERIIIAQARCLNLAYTMKRMADLVSTQSLTSNVVLLRPVNGENKRPVPMLLPTKRGTAVDGCPDIIYTSTTKPSGDNVKTLDVVDAGINLMYTAWMETMDFFSNLEPPSRMTPWEIKNSMQIGDRWYSMGGKPTASVEPSKITRCEGTRIDPIASCLPKFQFKLFLESPRIVIDSDSDGSSVILHMDQFDYLHINDGSSTLIKRFFFVHNLELYTVSSSSTNRDSYSVENSLIHPWSFLGRWQRCNEEGKSICQQHKLQVAAEILKARAAYSDLSIALDVAVRLSTDIDEMQRKKSDDCSKSSGIEAKAAEYGGNSEPHVQGDREISPDCAKHSTLVQVRFEGLDILVVDDSMRQFAAPQELISFSMGRCVLFREHMSEASSLIQEGVTVPSSVSSCPATRLVIGVSSLDLFDRLQKAGSRFSLAATNRDIDAKRRRKGPMNVFVFEWRTYAVVDDSSWGFAPSTFLIELLDDDKAFSLDDSNTADSIVYENVVISNVSCRHLLNIPSLSLQWNPSTVIALQRFLGRLMKEVRLKSGSIDSAHTDLTPSDQLIDKESEAVPVQAIVSVGTLILCLNKEHQNRRLLKATLTGIGVSVDVTANEDAVYVGRVDDVKVVDEDEYDTPGIADDNRTILKVQKDLQVLSPDDENFAFFKFNYSKFPDGSSSSQQGTPLWVIEKAEVSSDGEVKKIDDYLSVTVATVQLTYIRERTDELIDYLSNGLPGRGMGLTSKAAKGFINKRIQTRSFLELNIAAPKLRIPLKEGSENGLLLRLGDVHLRTWFELDDERDGLARTAWCRALSCDILGLGWNSYILHNVQTSEDSPIDLHFELRKPMQRSKAMVVRGELSFVVMKLKYKDYCLLRAVLTHNIGRKPNVAKWDNIEKAFWMEIAEANETKPGSSDWHNEVDSRVAYSSSARIVRYGTEGRLLKKGSSLSPISGTASMPSSNDGSENVVDFKFKMDGIRLTLHRDDDIETEAVLDSSFALAFNYDIALLRLDVVEVSFSLSADGDTSFHATLSRIGLFDKGDGGRLSREQYLINLASLDSEGGGASEPPKATRSPCAFSVIAEGCTPTERELAAPRHREEEAQIVLTVDNCPASAVGAIGSSYSTELSCERVTIARMVINYLSINAMIRPMREIVSFLTCDWSSGNGASSPSVDHTLSNASSGTEKDEPLKAPKSSPGFQLKLVAHYPRVFFVADESDPHSRALVLRGLAVVNASVYKKSYATLQKDISTTDESEFEQILSLDASLHSMESFINPDVSGALGMTKLGESDSSRDSTLGVALIQPVTAGIECHQVSKTRFPTVRSATLSMEPVSTMLSFEDLSLINQVLKRWSSEGKSGTGKGNIQPATESLETSKDRALRQYEITFNTPRLGLVLKKSVEGIIVDKIEPGAKFSLEMMKGDRLVLIDGVKPPGQSLSTVVHALAMRPRPMTLTFKREQLVTHVRETSQQSIRFPSPPRTAKTKDDSTIDFPKWYQLHFRMGVPCGILLQKSHGGDIPVVSNVDVCTFSLALVDKDGSSLLDRTPDYEVTTFDGITRIPKIGTAAIAVSGLKSVDLGFDESERVLEEFSKPTFGCDSSELRETAVYSISFLELSSDEWGTIDSFDASIAGMALTFIDDFQGRDMPLLRGRLDAFEIHFEGGIGLRDDMIDSATASVFNTVATAAEHLEAPDHVLEGFAAIRDLKCERVLKIAGWYQALIDYYHPRIAVWEPLWEPSRLALKTVWKPGICSGEQKRPGQLAIEISDDLNSVVGHSHPGRPLANTASLNITDAGMEVIARTLRQLERWKETVFDTASKDKVHSDASGARLSSDSNVGENSSPRKPSNIKRAAAREAAQAALLFARKRGAETNTTESAKPFVFRNETGLLLKFCEQGAATRGQVGPPRLRLDNPAVKTIAPNDQSKFQMEIISFPMFSAQSGESSVKSSDKKIRSYEGDFPSLTVWMDSAEKMTTFEPLFDLQVSKVGVFVKELKISRHQESTGKSEHTSSIPLLWQVKLEENRRILTLSSAVQVSPIALGMSLDLGYTSAFSNEHQSEIEVLGSVHPGETFYLPLWMSLKFHEQKVFLRPCCAGLNESYDWGETIVLEYKRQGSRSKSFGWSEAFSDSLSVECRKTSGSSLRASVHLACLSTTLPVHALGKKASGAKDDKATDSSGSMVNVIVDSSLTMRNMTPIPLQWELADLAFTLLDGSHDRSLNIQNEFHTKPGSCEEMLASDLSKNSVRLRIRPPQEMKWTDWALITCPGQQKRGSENEASIDKEDILDFKEMVVHSVDDFDCPFHFGVRLTRKLNQNLNGHAHCYGLELVIFTELWFRNLTSLPINFGCPWKQLNPQTSTHDNDDFSYFEVPSRAAAESALLEIASVLEFGDKGRGIAAVDQRREEHRNIRSIPLQASELLFNEVFEYIEVESSTVRRRWWGSEQHDSLRPEIAAYRNGGQFWEWIDDEWLLDSSGTIKEVEGAWESCRSLTGGPESYFSEKRTFNPSHRFRRRRWFRRQRCDGSQFGLQNGITCFHHPVGYMGAGGEGGSRYRRDDKKVKDQEGTFEFSLRCCDGEWSSLASIPLSGPHQGIVRAFSTRWPSITNDHAGKIRKSSRERDVTLTPELYDLCYNVSVLPGDWGEFSRMVTVTPRFSMRNESKQISFEVKQVGISDHESIVIPPGEMKPFYWGDFRLPKLVCVRPFRELDNFYRWSGGFDIFTLGTVPIRIRTKAFPDENDNLFSVKALVEIRPNSSGVNISLSDEDGKGVGSMFRIENHSPFPIWIAQDGVLANPTLGHNQSSIEQNEARKNHDQVHNLSDKPPEIDGDVVLPHSRKTFALDVPFRQGKYAKRKAATLQELLRVRVGLGPLSSFDGIETTKVIGFTTVGDSLRLNPTKLRSLSGRNYGLGSVRVLGLVITDGPTRVLRFSLIEKEISGKAGISEMMRFDSFPTSPFQTISKGDELLCQITTKAAIESIEMKQSGKLRKEDVAKREAFFNQQELELDNLELENDIVFSFRALFRGLIFSLVDSAPSEIATISVKGLEAAAKWNMHRTGDATAFISVGWLQVDNHVPNAPFPVAICPDHRVKDTEKTDGGSKSPLVMMSLKFAPRHKSGILCLRSLTIAPSNLAIAIDLAFIVRIQRLVTSVHDHFIRFEELNTGLVGLETIPFPDIATRLDGIGNVGGGSFKLYFEGLLILPSRVTLSVAPARALTPAQSLLEGSEAAGIHAAVRKGDVRLADGGMVGVSVGRTNRTAMAVVRGVFKSILVDALLRLDGASLILAGVSLKNHVSTSQQLKTYLVAHYLASLRSNVPALLGSLAAFGNPLGLIRGIGDGVSDFVSEPVKGLKRSVEELDPVYVVDGVARGTESLARHTVGGIADSASMLTETFSKNMAVLTLDRRYAQRRDMERSKHIEELNFVEGIESGVAQLVRGVFEGVTGVVRAPLRGAEKSGIEGFAKGIGKGLLGLLVKPMIGLSDAATDVMIGVKGSVDGGRHSARGVQLRPRRTMYGKDRTLRVYSLADAAAATLMLRTKLAGENYVSHLDMGDRVLLVSHKKFVLLGSDGQELLRAKFKHFKSIELRVLDEGNELTQWGVFLTLQRSNDETRVEVLRCGENHTMATQLLDQLQRGFNS